MTDDAMILDEIVAHKREEVAAKMAARSMEEVASQAERAPRPVSFRAALTRPGLAFITEIKGASPSAGTIRSDVDPVAIA
ncbi:MAG: indole-3-glycerol-phosphate synthase TrpC, partial [Armatimonadetes bacterium]|nr:indole-3-glycerol-phosphate synthase TrpC [Armatimonadota bacterium]